MEEAKNLDKIEKAQIKAILPHREPMLLVDGIERVSDNTVLGTYTVKGDEWFLQGHFPGNPVVPGVILCEIMAQSCCLLLADRIKGKTPYFTGLNNVKFRKKVLPGSVLEIECSLAKERHPFYFASGRIYVEGQLAASGEFSFAIMED